MLDGMYLVQEELKHENVMHAKQEFSKDADVYGQVRLAYIDDVHNASKSALKEQKSATAIGGELGLKSAEYNGLSFNISAYISQNIGFLSPSKEDLNPDFVNLNQDSFAYIGEASANYANAFAQVKIGRVKVETPYANSDDIRMAANTFEGAFAKMDYSQNISSELMFLNRWAGYDSQDTQSQDIFKNLYEDSKGMGIASLKYEYAKDSSVSLWINHIDAMSQIFYAEVAGSYAIEDSLSMDYGFQASTIHELENSGVAGNVYGLMANMHYKGAFLGLAYNKAYVQAQKSITDGFGGGPYYTSLDEATIGAMSEAAVGKNVEALRLSGGYDLKEVGNGALNGFMLEVVYGKLQSKEKSVLEKDIIVSYEMDEKWHTEAIYTNFSAGYEDENFHRTLVRANYSF